jgi:hypothetical protein
MTKILLRNEKSKNYDLFHDDAFPNQDAVNNEKFQEIFNLLKDKYKVVYKLFGEENFQAVSFEYYQYNPLHSAIIKDYGMSFPNFLENLEQLADYSFIKWLARVDWFWSSEKHNNKELTVPKGTLHSWANLYKDLPLVDIMLSENEGETIYIEQVGNQFSIKLR